MMHPTSRMRVPITPLHFEFLMILAIALRSAHVLSNPYVVRKINAHRYFARKAYVLS